MWFVHGPPATESSGPFEATVVLGTGALLVALSYPVPMQLLAPGAPSPALWPGAGTLFTHITNSTGDKLLFNAPGNEREMKQGLMVLA